ncbi:uncharacterized protein EV420DRAFT_120245 [Desarmillaria tabescens]|uniref:NmrA-like domain-containing protein n=1 Tax=Armillaria tabescens TaxID=1929756 RepID=A0AA39TWI8_ARMTA|nr:uncharacterized protein EV420DRAFT_120245 [Desarmillaria tabescens]KAK0461640.1 hypothetical protein EV420DRAFT_120245 [Desarmillaria tabescens]
MTTLITGGKGKTALRLARLMKDANKPFLVASRSGGDPADESPSCRFDWLDPTAYANPWSKAEDITSIYFVPPQVMDMLPPMKAFIDYCREKGVKRFVLLSASVVEPGGPAAGKVHEYLATIGVDYCVLRPTWFMENFSEERHRGPFKSEDKIYSATGDGKIPFVSAEDIAAVAFRALVDPQPHNTDHFIRGPELLSYDEVAEIITEVLGRKITHVKLTQLEMANWFTERGVPKEYAGMLALMDARIAKGAEETLDDAVLKVTGRPPVRFSTFAKSVRHVWE